METPSIVKLLLRRSPPVMLALLILSIYNIVDSYFVAQYSADGLTALSIIFPIQLLMTAVSTGTGTGLNILVSHMDGAKQNDGQSDLIRSSLVLGVVNYAVFTAVGLAAMHGYFGVSSNLEAVRAQGIQYTRIVLLGSFGMFIEGSCTKLLQAKGDMRTPMLAQVAGALINVVLDPILIFGQFGLPALGVSGAAIATIVGQIAAMGITLGTVFHRFQMHGTVRPRCFVQILRTGLPSIVMQSLYTVYIIGLNLILKQFTEDAVTVLGIYYKLQTFFFIPLMGLQQVILPMISYHHGAGQDNLSRRILLYSTCFTCGFMLLATAVFLAMPRTLLRIFSDSTSILSIGCYALRVIACSFVPAGVVMMFTVYFQGIGRGRASLAVTLLRQVVLLVPLAWLFHFAGLRSVWFTFVVTETATAAACLLLAHRRPSKPVVST